MELILFNVILIWLMLMKKKYYLMEYQYLSSVTNGWYLMNYFLLHMKVNDNNRLIRPKVIHFICTDNPNDDDFGCQLHLATVYFTNNSSSSGVGYIPFNGVPWKISKQYSPILIFNQFAFKSA